ncbi:MAG: hypothetical protein IJU57_05960 [Clostridia bacterium]|nr:hypothetical protein [Clostridia bacterium]
MEAVKKEHPVNGECLYISNGYVEAVIPLSFGIRITHFSLCGKDNLFYEDPADRPNFSTEEGWRLRGGYRVWAAPEGPWDYVPDNSPISWRAEGETLFLSERPDPRTGFRKKMEVTLLGNGIRVKGVLQNISDHDTDAAVWLVSSVVPGGVEIIPLPYSGNDTPRVGFCYWDHTDPSDERIKYGRDRLEIRSLPSDRPLKIGISHPAGPVRYELGSVSLIKRYDLDTDAVYPDKNSSWETYFCRHMTELESLSPLYTVRPGCEISHTEELLIETL